MKAIVLVCAAAGALLAGAVHAQGTDALKAAGCLGCHEMEKKKVGPALKDIAAKYKGDASAADKLVAKIKDGKGHPKSKAPDDQLKAAVGQALAAK
jgi:cytochrome c